MENEKASASSSAQDDTDKEFAAMRSIYSALKDLTPDAQNRVLDYVLKRLGLAKPQSRQEEEPFALERSRTEPQAQAETTAPTAEAASAQSDDLEGVSAVAVKWMKRNGLSFEQVSELFSLGVDEIDLVASKMPGKNVKERMRNVILLQGLAGLLSAGTARFTDQKLREACTHYGAYDQANFAAYLRDFAPDVSGTRESGYVLTTKGLVAAANLVKGMVGAPAGKKES